MSESERPPVDITPSAGGDNAVRPTPTPPARRSLGRRVLRWIGRILLAFFVVLMLALVSLWWWAGTNGSLATALNRAAGLLPSTQMLSSRDVTGSVRAGGHIGQLRYESPTLAVEVNDVAVGWQLAPLLHRAFTLGELHAKKVTLTPRTPADPPVKNTEPLTQLTLPLDIDLPFKVDELVWAGPPETVAHDLAGRYRYTGAHHLLDLEGVDVLDGHYSATVKLQGPAPMALQAALEARVAAPMPEGAAPLTVLANATVDGTLSGLAARLQISAKAHSEAGAATTTTTTTTASVAPGSNTVVGSGAETAKALRATVQAAIAPWAPQPVISAEAALSHLDVARLLPSAPRTDISGTIHAGPVSGSSVPAAPATAPPSAAPSAPATPGTSSVPVTPSLPSAALPAATVWQATIALVNAEAGPYDTQRLPLERIDAEARFDGHAWTVPKAHVELAGGTIDADGSWAPAPDPWQAHVTLDHINPAQLHTALDAAPLGGTAQVTQSGETISFALDLGAQQREAVAAAKASGAKLRLERAVVEGSLTSGKALEVPVLRIEAERARVQGSISAQLDKQSGQGKLDVTLPGATAKINAEIAPESGNAKVDAALADAAQLQRWIERLPGLSAVFAGSSIDGAARLDARWQGGWKTAQRQIESGKPEVGKPLRLDATLTSSKLDVRLAPAAAAATGKAATQAAAAVANAATGLPEKPANTNAPSFKPAPAPQTIALRDFRLALAGTPAAATLDLKGQVKLGAQQLLLSTGAQGGIIGPDRWRVGIEKLRLDAKDTTAIGRSPWIVQLVDPLDLTVRRAKPERGGSVTRLVVDASAGRATLQGPAPGTARIAWQPVHFEQTPAAAGSKRPAFLLQSKGTLRDLPMGWAQALASTGTDSIGVTGNLVFEGDWDVDVGAQLRADVRLARSSGDLRVLAGGAAVVRRIESTGTGAPSEVKTDAGGSDSPSTPAGLRVAEITVKAAGNDVRARLRWDSARAGNIEADATTRLTPQDGGWTLAPNAPLAGQIKSAVPDIGVWAVLAPPGWRIQGTLAADVALAGTLDAPKWRGTLQADQLSVKAAVEGIDLRNGRLRATLTGDRLQLDELRLEGGPANGARIGGQSGNISTVASEKAEGGGSLTATGSVDWGSGAKPADSGMTAALNVDIKRLRVLARTDRQASVSGQLQIGMQQGQVKVRGKLRTDRASIILPDGTAPSLDSDVVITSAALRREKAAKDAKVAKAQASAAQADADETAARANTPKPVAAKPPDVDVTFNLGDDFALQGQGITTRLEGELEIRSNAGTGGQPRIFGEVRTVQGQYRAYGQELNVETGIVRFNGPMTNPALDILAIRPNIDVRAGVRITGTAQAPRVSLYSDPPLPDAEALSWVVLGRSAASGGAEALVMQQAALALLGGLAPGGRQGNFASRLGLDEIGFKGPGAGEGASDAAITLGKRISKNIYLSYERSLSGTLGTLYIFYELTKHLKLRAEAGTQSGLDIIYTISFE